MPPRLQSEMDMTSHSESLPKLDVETILITEALSQRPASRTSDRVSAAFVSLAGVMSNDPAKLPRALCDVAMDLCGAATAGISILRRPANAEPYFYWEALAGAYESYVGGTTPRDFSPCGTTLDRGQAQLFLYPGRLFSYLDQASPPIVEGLVIPFYAAGEPLGTIWIVTHDEQHHFDAGHVRVMEQIGAFCGAAFHLLSLKNQAEGATQQLAEQAQMLLTANAVTQASLRQEGQVNLALQESNHAKDEFVSLVSHELRGPVSTIYGFARILLARGDSLGAAEVHESLETIEQESMRLNRILEDLLVLARPENGGPSLDRLEVTDALRDVIDDFRHLYPDRTISFEACGQRLEALANVDYVGQIVRNLLSNAEKYSPLDQPIDVSVQPLDLEVLIAVEDHGSGIPDAELAPIFDSFYRSPSAQKHASGMGIGLTVCKRLVDAQRGRIWVEPRTGGGARFCFTLPRTESDSR